MNFLYRIFGIDGKVDHIVSAIEKFIVIFVGFSALVVMLVNILGRYLFNNSLVWAEEYARYCLIILVYFGASLAVRRKAMLKVDIVVNIWPKLKNIMEYIEAFGGVIAMGFLCTVGFQYTGFVMKFGEKSAAMNWLPMWVVYAFLPISTFFITYRYLQRVVDLAFNRRNKKEAE